jgi:GntR family transcriptional regulator, galactonate operon transcriptional repressor
MSKRAQRRRRRAARDVGLKVDVAAVNATLAAPRAGKSVPLTRNIHDYLANRLGTEIISGAFPPGSLLPNEHILLQRFGVSRTALREAYRALNAKGLIVSRPKIGTRVRPKADWNMLDPDVLAWHLQTAPTAAFVEHLFQLRQMVEPPAAALAAASRDDRSMAPIAAAYADMERFKDGSGDLISADLRFHQAILEATGNHFIGAFGSLIHAALICTFERGWQSAATMRQNRLLQHRGVLDAIVDGEPDQARGRMEALLRDSVDDVLRSLRRRARSGQSVGEWAYPQDPSTGHAWGPKQPDRPKARGSRSGAVAPRPKRASNLSTPRPASKLIV